MVKDLVCGMEIDPNTAAGKSDYKGQTYYFCAPGCTVDADLCPDLVFLVDGAIWIWNLVDKYYPDAQQIVDWYHAEEHLEKVANSAFADATKRTSWLTEVTQFLWDGQVEDVISSCKAL